MYPRTKAGAEKHRKKKRVIESSIADTPFVDGCFDLIFSNHVIEQVEDLCSAFREMKRIGEPGCIYAFSVPTNIWLLLSLPARYYLKLRPFFGKEAGRTEHPGKPNLADKPAIIRGLDKLRPRGHGVICNFSACYRAFKIAAWRSRFEQNDLGVFKTGCRGEVVSPIGQGNPVPTKRFPTHFERTRMILW